MVDMKKEKEPGSGIDRVRLPEDLTTVEAPNRDKDNLEVSSWIEKIEKRFARTPSTPSDIADDTSSVAQPNLQQPPVTLPVTQGQVQAGKKASTDLGIAWLITWAIRQMKLIARAGKKVILQDSSENK